MPQVEIVELPPTPTPSPTLTPSPSPSPSPSPTPAPTPAKVYLATPCYGCHMTIPFLTSVLGLQSACAQRGIELQVDFVGNESLVERARNILVARFLQSSSTHMLFIDADIGFRPETVFRLLDFDKDVTTAVYSKKSFDWDKVKAKLAAGDTEAVHQMGLDFNINIASHSESITPEGFIKVLDSATGFMMLKRGVLERMTEHYREELYCVNDIMGQPVKEYVALFACMIDKDTNRFLSEDFSLCRRYQRLGGEIWADLASPLAHIGTHIFAGDAQHRIVAPQPLPLACAQ